MNLWKKRQKNSNEYKNFQQSCLISVSEYKDKQKDIFNLEKETHKLNREIERHYHTLDLKRTQQSPHECTKKLLEDTVKRHKKKLQKLNGGPVGQNYLTMKAKLVHNLSTDQLTEEEERLLARGWEFCIEKRVTDNTDIKTEIELNVKKP